MDDGHCLRKRLVLLLLLQRYQAGSISGMEDWWRKPQGPRTSEYNNPTGNFVQGVTRPHLGQTLIPRRCPLRGPSRVCKCLPHLEDREAHLGCCSPTRLPHCSYPILPPSVCGSAPCGLIDTSSRVPPFLLCLRSPAFSCVGCHMMLLSESLAAGASRCCCKLCERSRRKPPPKWDHGRRVVCATLMGHNAKCNEGTPTTTKNNTDRGRE